MIKIRLFLTSVAILSQLTSCSGHKLNKEKILGNWRIVNDDGNNVIYQEIFIDDTYIHYYEINLGMRPIAKYYIENNTLFHSQLGSKFEEIGQVKLEEGILTISKNNKKVSWKKIRATNVLEDLVNNNLTKDEFWEAYLNRYEDWLNR